MENHRPNPVEPIVCSGKASEGTLAERPLKADITLRSEEIQEQMRNKDLT